MEGEEHKIGAALNGIAGCCALAACGHEAAAPPRSDMNSRREIDA
jgi:hypothetical protein